MHVTSLWQQIRASLRQLYYQPEFRIRRPLLREDTIAELTESIAFLRRWAESHAGETADQLDPVPFREVATGLWRLRRKMVDTQTGQPLQQMARAYRHLESTWDALGQAGVEIQDHTNDRFDSGQTLRVLAFEPTDGVAEEHVSETVKPTVYFKGSVIQQGEVIVATPPAATAHD